MNHAYRQNGYRNERRNDQPSRFALTMAYVLMQPWEQPYDLKTGLCRGTMFQSLDKPFTGRRMHRHG